VVHGEAVAYANTATEADTIARPTAEGVETFTSLRSEEAPESFSWKLDLNGDEELRETSDGGVEIIDATPPPGHDVTVSQSPGGHMTQSELDELARSGDVPAGTQLPDAVADARAEAIEERVGKGDHRSRRVPGADRPRMPQAVPEDRQSCQGRARWDQGRQEDPPPQGASGSPVREPRICQAGA